MTDLRSDSDTSPNSSAILQAVKYLDIWPNFGFEAL